VVITDGVGCSGTQTFAITQPAAISASVTSTPSACGQSTGSASASASGGSGSFSYSWNNGQATATATGLSAGNYTVTITDSNGCTQLATANVSNSNGPSVSVASQTPTSCNGGSDGTATASASGGTSPYTFVWSNGQTSQSASGLSSSVYTFTVTDAGGCSNTLTVSISQPGAITASTTNTQAGCGLSDGTSTASASGGTGVFTYTWSNGQTSQTATGLAAGTYSVLITDANGCTQTATSNITNGNGPVANAGADVSVQLGSSAQLTASGGTTYSWSPVTGLSNAGIANPTASPTVTTTYCVLVSDAGGCVDSACVTVYVELPCGEFYLPNAFSPNGDGENDDFHAFINPDCVKEFQLIIYNRWGERIFETTDVTQPWNGEWRGGHSNPAVYAYYCKATLTNGIKINKEGNVSLVR
jgi:gliding motility-associated-like protein